jgi:hypothetical protein
MTVSGNASNARRRASVRRYARTTLPEGQRDALVGYGDMPVRDPTRDSGLQ